MKSMSFLWFVAVLFSAFVWVVPVVKGGFGIPADFPYQTALFVLRLLGCMTSLIATAYCLHRFIVGAVREAMK